MLWLDSIYPPEKEGQPGAARGDCPQDSGVPSEVEAQFPNAYVMPSALCPCHSTKTITNSGNSKVTYSNIRFGPIGSTVNV